MSTSPVARVAVVATCLAVLATLAFTVYGHVYAEGLCCGDDASIAVAAKNLAQGNGYTTTVPFFEGRGESEFDPALSTGPTLVIPAAGLIALVGPTTWAPGFTTATMAFGLLAALWSVHRRRFGNVRSLTYVAAAAVLLYLLSPGSVFIQWAILLGEIPAALLVIVGLAVLSREPLRRRDVAIASTLFGLAVLAKILAVLTVLPAAAWLLWRALRVPDGASGRGRRAQLMAAGFALVPIAVFELWKVARLGTDGYRQHLRDFVDFFDSSSTGTTSTERGLGAVVDRFGENWSLLLSTYGIAAVALGVGVGLTTVLLWRSARQDRSAGSVRAARYATLLLAGGASMLAYYLLVSNGIYRYALMGLLLWAAALPVVLLRASPVRWSGRSIAGPIGVAALAGTVIVGATADTGIDPISFAVRDGFTPSARLRNLEAAGDFIDANRGDHQLTRGWWATAADLEYVLDESGDFVEVTALTEQERATEPMLALNELWAQYAVSGELDAFAADCEPVFEASPFVVGVCPPDAGAPGGGSGSG